MALREPYMVKTVLGDADLSLIADPGQSLLIKNVFIHNPASNYITLRTEKTTVGYFRVGGSLGSHLPFPYGPAQHSLGFNLKGLTVTTIEYNQVTDQGGNDIDQAFGCEDVLAAPAVVPRMTYPQALYKPPLTILEYLALKGIFKGYPVAEGETFQITGAKQAGAIQLVQYEIHEAGDQSSVMENGSKATDYFLLQYGSTAAAINATAETIYDTPLTPPEFPNFPYDAVVPAKTAFSLLGLLASNSMVVDAAVANYTYTKYLKLIHERETLFDEDQNGILHQGLAGDIIAGLTAIAEGHGLFGSYSDIDTREPLIFPTPLDYGPGDELGIYLSTVQEGTGADITTALQEIALIAKVARTE